MKRLILTILAAGALTSAPAQLFSPQALNGAFLGSMIGGIAGGNHCHGFSGNGAAIGAGVGLLAGAAVGEAQRRSYYASQPCYYYPATAYAQPDQPATSVAWEHQIPDAPRVPDAPTF